MQSVWKYLVSFCADWIALMSGIASLVLTFVGAAVPKVPSSAVWLLGAGCFLLASYRVWLKEHRALEKANEQIRLLQEPKLSEERKREVEAKFTSLNDSEKEALRQIVLLGQMSREQINNHLVSKGFPNNPDVFDSIEAKTGFVRRTYRGHYEINPTLKLVLEDLLTEQSNRWMNC